MKISKVWINEKNKKCIVCGLCELIAPEVFKVTNKTTINPRANLDLFKIEIKDAVESCPQNVIKIDERK